MCDSCWTKEQSLKADMMKPENQLKRVQAMNHAAAVSLIASRAIDSSITTRSDVFNAETTSIIELKKIIGDNSEITNKPYALAVELKNRLDQYKKAIFDASEIVIENTNKQKAVQIYLNNFSNQLRAEERAELKIADITYNPQPVKSTSVKKISTGKSTTKVDLAELKKYAIELGISEFTLRSFMLGRPGTSVKDAADMIKKSIEAAKQA
jgi:hypothetical protein